jgi:hypothetical protein
MIVVKGKLNEAGTAPIHINDVFDDLDKGKLFKITTGFGHGNATLVASGLTFRKYRTDGKNICFGDNRQGYVNIPGSILSPDYRTIERIEKSGGVIEYTLKTTVGLRYEITIYT